MQARGSELAGPHRWLLVAIMSSGSHGEDLISEVIAHVAAACGPGTARLLNLFAESIARSVQVTSDQDSGVGSYVLLWGAEVRVTAPAAQRAPGRHRPVPAGSWSGCRWHPARGGAVHEVWPTSMR